MMVSFAITFLFFTALIGFWIFFSLTFVMNRIQASQTDLLESARKGITSQDVLSLAQEKTDAGLSQNPHYLNIINWLDTIHQVKPSAWPYVFVPGKNTGEILYVVDLRTRYTPDIAKKFMQAEILDTSRDESFPGDVYFHIDTQGLQKSFHSLNPRPPGPQGPLATVDPNNPGLSNIMDIFSQQITVYGYIRDDQGNAVVGVGLTDENLLAKDFNFQIIFLLSFSFIISMIIILLIILRTGNIITNPIVQLTWAAEKINSGDNESGLKILLNSTRHKNSMDEVGRLANTIQTLVSLQNALYAITEKASKTSDLNVLLEMTHKEFNQLIQADIFVIALFNEDTKMIRLICAACEPGSDFEYNNKEYPVGVPPDLIGYVIQTNHALLLNNRDFRKMLAAKLIADEADPVAFLGVPLQSADQKTFGALVAQSNTRGSRFTQNDLAFLTFIASQLVMIVNRSSTENELRQSHQLLEQRVRDRTADLQEANLQLEKEMGERERAEIEMQHAKEAAEAASIAKSAFLANMSHELRTPLNAILGFSRLMANDPNFPLPQKEDLGIILQSGEHLLDLINDVLDMSKIESGRMTLNPASFDLHQLLNEVEELFQARAVEKGLTMVDEISHDLPQFINTDEKKLRQVIYNLLSNAVKFTQSGGLIIRSRLIEPASAQKVHLGFEIEDTGSGISVEQIDDLFNYCVPTDAGKKSLEGTGLGLSISRNFVRMMGGDIRVTSEVGKGSIFAFDIFAEISASENIPAKIRERRAIGLQPGPREWRILIAEDREANRRLLLRLLQPFTTHEGINGFELREAVNGREAIEIWEEWAPDLIFMDMRMPEMNGHEATRYIRATEKGKSTRIIALTASAFEEERQFILSEGIDDFIRKPFKEFEIFEVLSKHLDGVNFIYSQENPDIPVETMSPEQQFSTVTSKVRGLPASWLRELNHAAAAADGERIYELLGQLDQPDPQLVSYIQNLVSQYRFDLVSKLLPEGI